MTKKVGFYTLGCKLNYAETEAIARNMSIQDYTTVPFSSFADYYVINTCSVTELANKKSRSAIRKALKINPEAIIIVVGCYAQLKPEEISKIEGVSIVLSTKDKFSIPFFIEKLESSQNSVIISSCERDDIEIFNNSYSLEKRTRSFLKVQDGCNYFCSYCTIPLARGKSRNAPISQLVSQAKEIANNTIREIVLTGINIGDFGQSTKESFFELIQELDKVDGIERYRISSIEPNLLTTEIIEFVRDSQKFMPHFHIPLQAGSDAVLKLMRRRYSTELFTQKINEIQTHIPHACIGVDVIVGTPGETEELFMETYSFLKTLPISYLHIFTYSEREGTDALNISPKVSKQERQKRSMLLHELSAKIQNDYYRACNNTIRPVLIETQKNNVYTGYTDNYIRTDVYSEEDIRNTIQKVQLCFQENNHMKGEIV
ncbi:MAG: tRNA (N(6)-L-threonylcarbamoyladenosine(37)-C(2))-methylthiotransferase MtaB [Bacteroidales bacterium]|jgi:threonylcarbamoyladenosine tRNA methylthiotransferase MtaB|nr:tRNA (N(6)-L-threonylcarbamoyladenosine(37)-C(2))-methylthiotransferase MtaB [Bacteroidales bacterium]